MLDIVLDCSILEKCGYIDAFSAEQDDVQLVLRLRQHRMVVSEALMDFYDEYFQNKSPEWQEWYRNYCAATFNIQSRAAIWEARNKTEFIKGNAYLNELINLCKRTGENILLLEPKSKIRKEQAEKWSISVIDIEDMKDEQGNNRFSMYTLPVNGKQIARDEDSSAVAKWFGRFLEQESYLQVIDNYLLTGEGIQYFKKYILKYVQAGADIEIYSMINDELPEADVRAEFTKDYYKKWKISVFAVKSKKDLHARSIQGGQYTIQVERGLSIFGRDGRTFHSVVSIYKNTKASRLVLKESQIRQII